MSVDVVGIRALIKRLYEFPTCEATGGPLHIVVEEDATADEALDLCERDLLSHWAVVEAGEDREALVGTARAIIAGLRALPVADRDAAVSAECPHGLTSESQLAGVAWSGAIGECRCCGATFGYIASFMMHGSEGLDYISRFEPDPTLCPTCDGKPLVEEWGDAGDVSTYTAGGGWTKIPGSLRDKYEPGTNPEAAPMREHPIPAKVAARSRYDGGPA